MSGRLETTADIGDFAASEFSHMRAATIDMNVASVAIGGKADKDNLDEAFKPKVVIERVKSAQALSDYGKLLLQLVNETQQDELRQASNNFVDSFKSVDGNKLSAAQYEGLGQLVQEIGTLWMEADKADAVKKIVPAAADDVDRLCSLLIKDFDPTQLNLSQGFEATISNLIVDSAIALKDQNATFENRLIASEGMKQASQERDHLNQISSQAVATLKQMQAANAQLKAALENDSLSIEDIKSLGREVNSLKIAAMALSGGK